MSRTVAEVMIVIGEVRVRGGFLDDALSLSREHVERSRLEPGCITHDVHLHADDDHRLVFVERWADRDALNTHFGVPESGVFVQAVTELAAEPPRIDVYEVVSGTGA